MENDITRVERLKILENAMINNYLPEIEFNSPDDIYNSYEKLLEKTIVEGAFDDIFLSDSLDNLDSYNRQSLIDLARKHKELCFYHEEFSNWSESVEGVTEGESMVAAILLSNFNYLIRLAKNGGEDVLKFLDKFKGNDLFRDGSVIALLINRFWGDVDSLEKVLIEMAKEDGKYKSFTDTEKVIMCNFPDGVLLRKQDDGSIEFIDSDELKKKITNEFIGLDNYAVKDIDSDNFLKIIRGFNAECLNGIVYKK